MMVITMNGMSLPPSPPPGKPPEGKPLPPKVKKPKISWNATQKLLNKIQENLTSPVICYYTSDSSALDNSHVNFFMEHLNKIGRQEKLTLVLVSNGGAGTAALRIASLLREYCQQLQVALPANCASAATLLSLAADKIIMTPLGYLTAIDPSLTHPLNPRGSFGPVPVSVDQIKRIIKFLSENTSTQETPYQTLFKYVHPLALGEIDRASSSSELIAVKMMKLHPGSFKDEEQMSWIANHLSNDYPTHGFPILYQEAKEIGLPVEKASDELNDILWDLIKAYAIVTQPAFTSLRIDFLHLEEFPVVIESPGKRTARYYCYDRILNPLKQWSTHNDHSRWVNLTKNNDSELPTMTTVDFAEKQSNSSPELQPSSSNPDKKENETPPQPPPIATTG